MDKKTKNIISLVIIIVLIISMILTIHFGKESSNRGSFNDRNMPSLNNNQSDSRERPSLSDQSITEDNKSLDRSNNRPSNMPSSFDNKNMSNFDMPGRSSSLSTCSIILLSVESFLLGGTVVFLIMNNYNNKSKK